MGADRARWDERWRTAGPPVPMPPDVLAEHPDVLQQLPTDGRGLDVACGLGAQALWLAQRGVQVTALDVSPVAIEQLRLASRQHGVTVDASVWNTDHGLPADLRDLATIICQRYRAPALYGEFVERLSVGGVMVLTVLSAVGVAGSAGPFHAEPGELRRAFDRADVDVLLDVEADGQASIVARRSR